MTTIMVSGANGQLGLSLKDTSDNYRDIKFVFLDKKELDITDEINFKTQIQRIKPDYFINAAAYTAVDKAESDQYNAILINGESLFHLGKICAQNNVKVIHISSDYVYHSIIKRALFETDPTQPKAVYAKSKLLGEDHLLKTTAESIIIRTSWVYSEHGNNFVKTMLRLSSERDELSIVNDQFGTPTYARDLASAIIQIINKTEVQQLKWQGEIYNYCNSNYTNWFDFASFIFDEMKIQIQLKSIPTSSYPTPASRPKNSRLDTKKIQREWDISIRSWQEACNEMLKIYRTKNNGKS